MAKLLWISDAGRPTGFGTVTHALAERLVRDYGHEIHVLAIGWDAKYPYEGPLKLYRAEAGPAHNHLGYDRTLELVNRIEPDVVVLNEDIPMSLKRLTANRFDPEKKVLGRQPIISYAPIDAYGIPQAWKDFAKLVTVVPYTRFGAEALGLGGYIHHGVDPVFRRLPYVERMEVRKAFNIPPKAFVVGRIDTNSGRKDWGSTAKVMGGLTAGAERPVVGIFHTKLNNPGSGVDLQAVLARQKGTTCIVTNETDWPVEDLVRLINAFDVTLSTSRGEGWGLSLAESLACGVPVVATKCSSIPEVVGPGGVLVEGQALMTNPYGVDLVLADYQKMAEELIRLSRDHPSTRALGRAGMEHVKQFDWDETARQFNPIIQAHLA